VIETCNRYGAVSAPGVMTPTEAIRGYEAGADFVKVFPAKTVGPAHLGAMKGPLGQIPMMPTGGVGPDNAADYIDAGAFAVGAGGALVDYDDGARAATTSRSPRPPASSCKWLRTRAATTEAAISL